LWCRHLACTVQACGLHPRLGLVVHPRRLVGKGQPSVGDAAARAGRHIVRKLFGARLTPFVLAAVSVVVWLCLIWERPKVTMHGSHMTKEYAREIIVHRVLENGETVKLGEHRKRPREIVHCIPGPGDLYGISLWPRVPNARWSTRIYRAGMEVYTLPPGHTWKGWRGSVRNILTEGRLLMVYNTTTVPRMHIARGPILLLLRILAYDEDGAPTYGVVTTPSVIHSVAVSGDGRVGVVCLGEKALHNGGDSRSKLFSTADGKALWSAADFRATWISHDGNTLVGRRAGGIAVYVDGEAIAERPWKNPPMLTTSANGKYTMAWTLGWPVHILDTLTLKTIRKVDRSYGYKGASAISSDGRLALYEYRIPGGG